MKKALTLGGIGCGLLSILIGVTIVSSYDHLLLKSALVYFGFVYTISNIFIIIRSYFNPNPISEGIVGFVFVLSGTLLIGFIPFEVWPGSSSFSGLYNANGFAWAFVSTMMYSAFNYALRRDFSSRITSTGMLLLSMYPLLVSVFKVVEEGSPQAASEHLMPLLLIYGLGILASVPLYISGQSLERKGQPNTRDQSSKPVGIAVVCSFYVVSFLVGLSYYHSPLANLGSVSFLALLITPVLVVAHTIWKVSFGSPETHVRN